MSRKTRAAERKARVEAARVKCEALVNERPDEHKITPEKIAAIPAPWIEAEGENWMDGDPYSFTESGELGMCLLLVLHKYIDPDLVVERGRQDDGVGVFLLLAKAAERFIAGNLLTGIAPGGFESSGTTIPGRRARRRSSYASSK